MFLENVSAVLNIVSSLSPGFFSSLVKMLQPNKQNKRKLNLDSVLEKIAHQMSHPNLVGCSSILDDRNP